MSSKSHILTSKCTTTVYKSSNKKGSPTKIAISQLPDILEGFIKAQIKGFNVRYSLMIVLYFYFTLGLEKFK